MVSRRIENYCRLLCAIMVLTASSLASASESHGQVTFSGLPVPGATVTATHGTQQFATITDRQGLYSFSDLTDGTWTIEVEMLCFSTIKQDVVITPNGPAAKWELKMLPLDQIKAEIRPLVSAATLEPLQVRSDQTKPENNEAPEIEATLVTDEDVDTQDAKVRVLPIQAKSVPVQQIL